MPAIGEAMPIWHTKRTRRNGLLLVSELLLHRRCFNSFYIYFSCLFALMLTCKTSGWSLFWIELFISVFANSQRNESVERRLKFRKCVTWVNSAKNYGEPNDIYCYSSRLLNMLESGRAKRLFLLIRKLKLNEIWYILLVFCRFRSAIIVRTKRKSGSLSLCCFFFHHSGQFVKHYNNNLVWMMNVLFLN